MRKAGCGDKAWRNVHPPLMVPFAGLPAPDRFPVLRALTKTVADAVCPQGTRPRERVMVTAGTAR
ncbi:hypothetical protein A0U93_09450 [Neoasaia chiangmaiensis]|uniref:Uncharacterized protein n=1 Tax=Neoasaia chiangmaiensis TaxID=320497 RepID=A0A1U9KQX8_9PROT|nr:hypothetical protein A0U93_09450 [Neoasaia chiangmaiensis]